jgi:hypothetical protein
MIELDVHQVDAALAHEPFLTLTCMRRRAILPDELLPELSVHVPAGTLFTDEHVIHIPAGPYHVNGVTLISRHTTIKTWKHDLVRAHENDAIAYRFDLLA